MTGPGDRSPFGLSLMREPGDDPGRRLRPAPMTSLFEIGFRVVRRHALVLLGVSVLVGLPGALLGATASLPLGETMVRLLPESGSTTAVTVSEADVRELGEGLLLALAGSLVAGILAAIASVGFAWVVARDYHAERVTLGDTLRRALSRALPALGTAFLAGLATIGLLVLGAAAVLGVLALLAPSGPSAGGLGVFAAILVGVVAVIAFVVVSVRWALAISIVAIEEIGPMAALRRSWHLTGSAIWRTFFALLLIGLIVAILGTLVTQLLAIVIVDLVAGPAGGRLVGETLVSALVSVLFAPVTTVVMTVYLFDQMVRRDRFDLPAPPAPPTPWDGTA